MISKERYFRTAPPSAPECTLQASGQGQATASPKGGPPRCSVPISYTRWAASSTSPLMKPSYVGMCKDKPTHVQLQPNEIPGKEIFEYTGGRRARNTKSFAKEAQALLSRLPHASNFLKFL
jgi:hypothetical protein